MTSSMLIISLQNSRLNFLAIILVAELHIPALLHSLGNLRLSKSFENSFITTYFYKESSAFKMLSP